jgi:hypothetical protein
MCTALEWLPQALLGLVFAFYTQTNVFRLLKLNKKAASSGGPKLAQTGHQERLY